METTNKDTAVVPVKQSEITDQVLARINQMQETGSIRLPKDYSAENALKSAYFVLLETETRDKKPVLEACTKVSIANTLLSMVVQALDPVKKQCYFIAYGDKLALSRSYFGTIAVAKRVAGVKSAKPTLVYTDDIFEYGVDIETGKYTIYKHESKLANIDDNKIAGAYCTVIFENGDKDIEIMTITQIKKAWQQGASKGGSPAHTNFTGEMAKKSVINRALKPYINSSDDAALYEEEEIDTDKVQADVKHEVKSNANGAPLDIDDAEIVPPASEPIVNEPQGNEKPSFA